MRVRVGIVAAYGLALAAAGMPYGHVHGGHALSLAAARDDYRFSLGSEISCGNPATTCVNGSVNSGNVRGSQNVASHGNASESYHIFNSNGSVNSGNEITGDETNSENNSQGNGSGGKRAG